MQSSFFPAAASGIRPNISAAREKQSVDRAAVRERSSYSPAAEMARPKAGADDTSDRIST
jgi:hypothetical protein